MSHVWTLLRKELTVHINDRLLRRNLEYSPQNDGEDIKLHHGLDAGPRHAYSLHDLMLYVNPMNG